MGQVLHGSATKTEPVEADELVDAVETALRHSAWVPRT